VASLSSSDLELARYLRLRKSGYLSGIIEYQGANWEFEARRIILPLVVAVRYKILDGIRNPGMVQHIRACVDGSHGFLELRDCILDHTLDLSGVVDRSKRCGCSGLA